ncbi:hypothetical protein PI124_g16512 [Phytophthora idaei]|nr:hypothetical protein PI126_g17818 [Phytophthora idaei]KAG3238536.1 hypothetical protein PI124_g16512 [Phytophthora idaei]
MAVDAPPQGVVPGLEQQLAALLATINATHPTAAAAARPRPGPAARAGTAGPTGPGDDGGGNSDDRSSSSDDCSYIDRCDDSDSSSNGGPQRGQHRRRRHVTKKNAKELDLQPFKPQVGGIRIETWFAKVDLAVQCARISGRGDWSEK